MKKVIFTLVLVVISLAFYATDFILADGSIIIGELKGINSGSMYIVDTSEQLHVIAMDNIQVINNGSGDVSSIWKRRKPFMDIDPDKYQANTMGSIPADQKPSLLAPPPKYPSAEASLAGINKALWTQVYIVEGTLAMAIIGGLVFVLTRK